MSNFLLLLSSLLSVIIINEAIVNVHGEETCVINETGRKVCSINKKEYIVDVDGDTEVEVSKVECKDKHEKCEEWARASKCSNNWYMVENCKLTCNLCGEKTESAPGMLTDDQVMAMMEFGVVQQIYGEFADRIKEVVLESIEFMNEEDEDGEEVNYDGCENKHELCAYWAAMGECDDNPVFMEASCGPSCLDCDESIGRALETEQDTTPQYKSVGLLEEEYQIETIVDMSDMMHLMENSNTRPTQKKIVDKKVNFGEAAEICQDDHEKCEDWAARNKCTENAKYMLKKCKLSCGICESEPESDEDSYDDEDDSDVSTEECKDDHEKCKDWAARDKCTANAKYMHKRCKLSCGVCKLNTDEGTAVKDKLSEVVDLSCKDSDDGCGEWAKSGECTNNPQWMQENCKLSCGSCDEDVKQTLKFGVPQDISGNAIEVARTKKVILETTEYMNNLSSDDSSSSDSCKNSHVLCSFWAGDGQCDSNKVFMRRECSPSCQSC